MKTAQLITDLITDVIKITATITGIYGAFTVALYVIGFLVHPSISRVADTLLGFALGLL